MLLGLEAVILERLTLGQLRQVGLGVCPVLPAPQAHATKLIAASAATRRIAANTVSAGAA